MSDTNPDLDADDGPTNGGDAASAQSDAPADGSTTDGSQRPRREVAVRVLATEYEEATCSYAESEEERAPTYVVTPTGARANRVFVVGVLTEVERVSSDVIRARIADPTGTFVVYAGQYQPDARGTFESTEPPEFIALTGKARTFSPDDSDEVYASIRPESVGIVDAETRDRWALRTAERTVERVDTMADVCDTMDDLTTLSDRTALPESLAAGIPRARDHYDTTPAYLRSLRTCACEVAELVAGDRDAVTPPEDGPDAGAGSFDDVPTTRSLREDEDESPGRTAAGGDRAAESEDGQQPETDAKTVDPPADGIGASSTTSDGATGETAADVEATGDSAERSHNRDQDTADATVGADESLEDPLDADEREQVENEFGAEFESGAEVDGPGEAEIETPDTDVTPGGDVPDDSTPGSDDPDEESDDIGGQSDDGDASASDEDPELTDAVMQVMRELDDGAGADRGAVIEGAVELTDCSEAAVEDAVTGALMDGRCYEPDDTTLKPI